MAKNLKFFYPGIRIKGVTPLTLNSAGEIQQDSSNGKLNYHNGSSASPIVTESHTATLTNKTLTNPIINGGTISGVSISLDDTNSSFNLSLISTSGLSANRNLVFDTNDGNRTLDISGNLTLSSDFSTTGTGSFTLISNNSNRQLDFSGDLTLGGNFSTENDVSISGNFTLDLTITNNTTLTLPITGTLATLAGSETFTNKTLTSPVINGANITIGTAGNSNKITIGKDSFSNLSALTRVEATLMYGTDTQLLYIDNGTSLLPIGGNFTTYSNENISNGGTVSISSTIGLQYRRITGNGGAVIASTTPFGSSPPSSGTIIRLVGQSDTNTVTFVNNDTSNGMVLNGTCTLGQYDILEVQYDSVAQRYIEVFRNN